MAGYVVRLLWDTPMVQSGAVCTFGSRLRLVIGRTLSNRVAERTRVRQVPGAQSSLGAQTASS
jgi:hypothetical protein